MTWNERIEAIKLKILEASSNAHSMKRGFVLFSDLWSIFDSVKDPEPKAECRHGSDSICLNCAEMAHPKPKPDTIEIERKAVEKWLSYDVNDEAFIDILSKALKERGD